MNILRSGQRDSGANEPGSSDTMDTQNSEGLDGSQHSSRNELLKTESTMPLFIALTLMMVLCPANQSHAEDVSLVTLLRAQAFNKMFDGFDFYHVRIERDVTNSGGEHEVTAVASGKFLDQTRRVKVQFLVVGETVVRGQVLEEQGLPPCLLSVRPREESL